MIAKYLRWVAVAAFAVGVGLLAGCSEVGEPTTSSGDSGLDTWYGVTGFVYTTDPGGGFTPVEGVYCCVYCWDCASYVFGSDTSNKYGQYWCQGTYAEAIAHDGHTMTVYGIVDNVVAYESAQFEFEYPSVTVNLYPAGGD
ncbi:MAG: hypothetical protein PVH29_09385 [Candidatus Zixiibacteriota bacterium]|jgi:hypothetical protein